MPINNLGTGVLRPQRSPSRRERYAVSQPPTPELLQPAGDVSIWLVASPIARASFQHAALRYSLLCRVPDRQFKAKGAYGTTRGKGAGFFSVRDWMVYRAIERWRIGGYWGFGLAVAAFLLAFGIRFGLNDWLPPATVPFLFFVLAVIVTAFFAGLWPGVLCAALSGLAAWYFFLAPPHPLSFSPQNVLNLGAYALVSTAV